MRWPTTLSVLLLLPLSALARAAAPEESPASLQRAEEIVVADDTLRPAEIFQDAPVETEILTSEVIEDLPATNVAEAVEGLPGIRMQRRVQGEGAAVSIEGLPPSFTMILVNGQRYSGEFGGVDDLRDVPLANVERIEIKRGANGLRYGPEAGGGVIDIITKDPPLDGGSYEVGGGGGGDAKVVAHATPAFGWDDYGVGVTVEYDQIGGFASPDDLDGYAAIPFGKDSRRDSQDVYGTFRWTPTPAVTAYNRFGWRRRHEDLVNDLATVDDESSRVLGAATYLRGTTDSDVGREFEMDEDELRVQLAVEHFFEFWRVGNNVSFGGDYRRTTLDLQQEPFAAPLNPSLSLEPDADEHFDHGGIFAIGEMEISSWLSSDVGARLQFHSQTSPKLLPHAAVMVTPWRAGDGRSAKIRASVGRNYRIPTLREFYQPPVAQLGGAYFLAGNEDLEPEESIAYRVGVEIDPVSWLSLSATAFHNEISDHIRSQAAGSIVTGFELLPADMSPGSPCAQFGHLIPALCAPIVLDVPATVYRKTNVDDVKTRGVEARMHLRPHRSFDLQVGYTFLDTEVDDSSIDLDELPNEPRHVVDTRVTLTAPVVDTRLTVRTRWRSSAIIEGSGTGLLTFATTERSSPSVTVDLRVVQPFGEHVEVYADVYNATNNRFVDSYVVRGRSYFAGLRAWF